MPYILLTFDEIAELFHCDAAGARRRVIENQWERRRWADGHTRVHVPPEVAHQFMLNYAAQYAQYLPPAPGVGGASIADVDAPERLAQTEPVRIEASFRSEHCSVA